MKKKLFSLSLMFSCGLGAQQASQLFEMSLDELLNVSVTTPGKFAQSLDAAPGVTTVITREEIQSLGAGSLYEVLERAPAVQMMGSFFYPQNLAVIRGMQLTHASNEVLILLNGRPMRDSFTGGENFAFFTAFPIDSLKHIEIIRGPGSVLYGSNAFAGVINLVTLEKQAEPKVTLAAGSEGRQALELQSGWQGEEGNLNLFFRGFKEDGWQFSALDNGAQPGQFDAGEKNHSLLVTANIGGLEINALHAYSEQDFWGSVSSWTSGPAQDERQASSRRALLDVGYSLEISEPLTLDLNAGYASSDFSHYNYDASSDNYLLEAMLDYQMADAGRWLMGGTLWHQSIDTTPGLSVAPIPAFSQNWYSFYAQYQSRNQTPLNWYLGTQINKVENVDANTEFRAGIVYQLDAKQGLKLDYGGAFRAAYAVETQFDLIICCDDQGNNRGGLRGNPALEPEQVDTLQAQYFRTEGGHRYALSVFYSELSELVERQRAADRVLDFVNRGSLDVYGLELEGRYILDASQFNYSYSYQKNKNHGVDDFSLMPNHLVKWSYLWHGSQDWSAAIHHTWSSGFHSNSIRNPNTFVVNPEPGAYHLLGLTVTRHFQIGTKQAELSLTADNVLDEDIYQPEIAGRTINSHPARAGANAMLWLSIVL
ncbi:TonB-dependent receptor plug domain-containing protein [Aliiglaciecola sp. CAU 1673]|uniref:TonB-dependent receptor plug domain-containing protein n=1 Tax=Aliiglaciecola sp. CAU 1673 TaxID=3032595 RepID=UPI0023DCDD14|nr:TonB-dependent receptor plug domain-containing protein [Aliiglaciecola sp. CAU 1673]MDF2178908.1 TonB-dependent receptor plug domain-containing protein [Aliiglaciecola sp. CAU 1673]